MKETRQTILSVSAVSCMMAAIIGFSTSSARADAPPSKDPNVTIVYFLRHAEDMPELQGDSTWQATVTLTNCVGSCCLEVLNPLGKVRATVLADWFEEQQITRTLTHVIASHKFRTRQTVQPIAQAALLAGAPLVDVADQQPGDYVINIPSTPAECSPGFTGAGSSRQPQINLINALPLGSRAVVCGHSPTLYPIMRAFRIDTSDPDKFPKSPTNPDRVTGFNNLWIVELRPAESGSGYGGRLLSHLLLDFKLSPSLIDRDYGIRSSNGAMDDQE